VNKEANRPKAETCDTSLRWEAVGNGFVLKAGAALLQAWKSDRGEWRACASIYADRLVPGAYSRCAYKQVNGLAGENEAKETAVRVAKQLIAMAVDGLRQAEAVLPCVNPADPHDGCLDCGGTGWSGGVIGSACDVPRLK